MELWLNLKTREAIITEAGRICYDPIWRCLGQSKGVARDLIAIKALNGWFKV